MSKYWFVAAPIALIWTSANAQDVASGKIVLIAKGATWSYYAPTGEPRGDWKRGKGTKGWHSGKTSIGYDKGDIITIFPAFAKAQKGHPGGDQHGDHTHADAGNEVSKKYPAIYYRRTFDWNPALATGGRIAIMSGRCDDACAIFVNGQEVNRIHLPEGPIKFYATEGMMKSAFYPFSVPEEMLVEGKNQIAVVVYNSSPEDHDHAFNAELVVDLPPYIGG